MLLLQNFESVNKHLCWTLFEATKTKKTPQQQTILGIKDSLESAKLPMEL
jgi:hypothetical protein